MRDGNNSLQYPAPSCGGGVHCLGEYIMGSLWKMRENLISLHGYENGVAISDNLFYLGQVGAPLNDHDFVDDIFLADDDDGNLENGTPHYYQICTAFDAHNLMEFENDQNCDNAFAELEYSIESLDFELMPDGIASQDITQKKEILEFVEILSKLSELSKYRPSDVIYKIIMSISNQLFN